MAFQNRPRDVLHRFLAAMAVVARATDALGILTGVVLLLYLAGLLFATIKIALWLLLGAALLIGGLAAFYGLVPPPFGANSGDRRVNRLIAKNCVEVFLIVALVLASLQGSGDPTKSEAGPSRNGTLGRKEEVHRAVAATPETTRNGGGVPSGAPEAEVALYCAQAASRMMSLSDAIRSVTDFSEEANKNPNVFSDNNWRSKWAMAAEHLRISGKSVGSVAPVPSQMQKINGVLHQLADETNVCAELTVRAVEEPDATMLKDVALRLQRIDELLKKVDNLTSEAKRPGSIPS
jgi:hypothetical protein